jgi:hypothetical protein
MGVRGNVTRFAPLGILVQVGGPELPAGPNDSDEVEGTGDD